MPRLARLLRVAEFHKSKLLETNARAYSSLLSFRTANLPQAEASHVTEVSVWSPYPQCRLMCLRAQVQSNMQAFKKKIKIKKLKKYSFDVLSNTSKSSLQGAEAKDKWKIGPWPLFYSNIAVVLFMSGRL